MGSQLTLVPPTGVTNTMRVVAQWTAGHLGLVPRVEVDGHADGRVAHGNVDGHLARGVGEVACVGADALDEQHAVDPAPLERILVGGRHVRG